MSHQIYTRITLRRFRTLHLKTLVFRYFGKPYYNNPQTLCAVLAIALETGESVQKSEDCMK